MTEDLTGRKFGRWLVLKRAPNTRRNAAAWVCRCECGKISQILSSNLRCGRTHGCVKCNCGKSTRNSVRFDSSGKENKVYKAWKNMKYRCSENNQRDKKLYFDRGITVCNEWKNDFLAFKSYVSTLPHFNESGFSLDRINNDLGYFPGNVRWATPYEQTHNRRSTKDWRQAP